MTGPVGQLQERLRRYRLSASEATQEAANAKDAKARRSYVLLANSWTVVADDLEHTLNGDARDD
jgi:hypothetical protein